jgi:Uma2 family endonuclease
MAVTALPPVRTRRFRRVEYERLTEMGFFRPGERLELIDGYLLVREPQGSPHATAVQLTSDALRAAFGRGWYVRSQFPVALDDDSEPEPDVAVVRGQPRDYRDAHPSECVLVVEVSESSLAFDRQYKASLYARAGVAEYWIVNLIERVLEVRRYPEPSDTAPYGWSYRTLDVLAPPATLAPLAAPGASASVADLLP